MWALKILRVAVCVCVSEYVKNNICCTEFKIWKETETRELIFYLSEIKKLAFYSTAIVGALYAIWTK